MTAGRLFCHNIGIYDMLEGEIDNVVKALDEFTEEECIKYADWLLNRMMPYFASAFDKDSSAVKELKKQLFLKFQEETKLNP